MKKTKLLTLTALTLIGLLGLSSCNGEKGDKGDTGPAGPTGETGPKGDKGDPGEDGEDGKDGSTWLTGTSKPADTLGKVGDMYLNTTNGDVYQKEEAGWTLKMNIKGEDGEDGKDGLNGSTGSQGKPGETAYSNTILPVEGGYITSNVGSALVGEEVTFTFVPTDSSGDVSFVWDIKNNGTVVYSDTGLETTAIKMMEGGFVVSGKVATSVTPDTTGGSLKVEVPTGTQAGEAVVVNVNEDLTASKIEISGNTNNNPVVIDGKKEDGSNAKLTLTDKSSITSSDDLTLSNITLSAEVGSETSFNGDENIISYVRKGGSLTLENVSLDVTSKDSMGNNALHTLIQAETSDITLSNVRVSYDGKDSGVSLMTQLTSSTISNLEISNTDVKGLTGTIISAQQFADDASITIKDSSFEGKTNFLTLADYEKTTNSENKSVSINLENLNINDNGKNPVIMFNLWQQNDLTTYSSQDSASYFDVNVNNLTHNGVKLTKDNLKTEYQYNNVETENTVSTLAGDSGETISKPGRLTTTIKGGLLAVFDACWGNNSYDKLELLAKDEKYPKDVSVNGVKIEAKASNFVKVANVEGDVKTVQNVFINGQLYSEVTYLDNNGDKKVLKGTPLEGVKFAGGDGSKENPLEINSLEMFKLIGDPNVVKSGVSYFKLTDDITNLDTRFPISSRKETHIDLNGKNITTSEEALKESTNNVTTNVIGESVVLDLFNSSKTKSKIEYNFTNENSNNTSAFLVKEGASLFLNNVSLSGGETGITCIGDASRVEIVNSDVEGHNLGIGTNASTSENYNPTIIVKDGSTVSSVDGSAILMNVPGTLTIEDSTLTGQDQVLFARAGTTTVSNSSIILQEEPSVTSETTEEDYWQNKYYNNNTWGSGNSAIRAGILVGNRETKGYDSNKVVTLNNVTFKDESKYLDHPLLCGYLSEKELQEGLEVSITLDKTTLDNLSLDKLSLTNSKLVYEDKQLTLGESVEIDGVTYLKALYYEDNGIKVLVKGNQETPTNE